MKNWLKALLCALSVMILLSFANSANVEITGFPSHITFNQTPEMLNFTIKNNSDYRIPVSITFFMPIDYEIVSGISWIDSGKAENYSFRLIPKESLYGSSYESRIVIKAGNEEITKNLNLIFSRLPDNEAIEISLNSKEENGTIKVVGTIKNKSINSKTISLKGYDLPDGWSASFSDLKVDAMSSKSFSINIMPRSAYAGEISLIFDADGLEIKKALSVDYKGKESIVSGFAAMGNLVVVKDYELLLNTLLAIVCVILLIALFARIIKRVPAAIKPKEVSEEEPAEDSPNENRAKIIEMDNPELESLKNKILEKG